MTLEERIATDLKQAMRDKDEVTRDTLRMIKTELSRKELESGQPLSDKDQIAILSRAVKTRTESAQQYTEGGRQDLAEQERAEIKVVERYLPKALSDEEARAAIKQIVAEVGAESKRDMGKVMKLVNDRFAGQVDGKNASKIVGELLS